MSTNEEAPADGATPPPWEGPTDPQRFDVVFGESGPFGVGGKPDPELQLLGKGEAHIDATGLRLSGKKRVFLESSPKQVELAGEAILNVTANGKQVRFQAYLPDKRLVWIGFAAEDESQAARIAALLPARQSENFAGQLAELRDFHARLDAATQRPIVTPVLVAFNVIVFVAMAVGGAGVFEPDGEVAVRWGSNYGPLTLGGEWWRLLSSTFIHFGIIHLLLNMLALYQTGATTERLFGRGRFLALYLFAGLTGSLVSMIWNPIVNGAGASGAIFGVFGGLLAFTLDPRNRVPRSVMTEHRNSTLLFAGYSLFYGAVHPNIDNAAHIGGLVGGLLIGLLLARPVEAGARAAVGGKRLLLSAVAAAAVLAAMFAAASHPREAVRNRLLYSQYIQTFQEREAKAISLMDQANELAPKGQSFSAPKMAEAHAEWRRLHQDLQPIALAPDSPNAAQRTALLAYVEARARQTELLSRFSADPSVTEAAIAQADADASKALESLK